LKDYVETVAGASGSVPDPESYYQLHGKVPVYQLNSQGQSRVKIIVTLRNLVDRAFSHFRKRERESKNFWQLEDVMTNSSLYLGAAHFVVPDNAPRFQLPITPTTLLV
jgi:hypothetical protein